MAQPCRQCTLTLKAILVPYNVFLKLLFVQLFYRKGYTTKQSIKLKTKFEEILLLLVVCS